MRPWRLLIEVGGPVEAAPAATNNSTTVITSVPEVDEGKVWDTLKDARSNMLKARSGGNLAEAEKINTWIGGALAALAALTGKDGPSLLSRLTTEVPNAAEAATAAVPESQEAQPTSNARFYPVERTRPKPPPGAPRPVDIDELTPEERKQLGIDPPDEVVAEKPAKAVPVKKKAAAKKPARKAPSKRSA